MNFKDFYKLLDEVMTKDDSGIFPTNENYSQFLMNRYLSFYHPEIAVHISKTTNIMNWIPESDDENMSFKCIKSVIPKIPKVFIQYQKKPSVIINEELGVYEDEITEEAKLNECSKREIRFLISDYAKRS